MADPQQHWTKLGNWERLDSGVLVCKGDAPLVKKRLPIRLGVGIKVLDDEQRVIRVTINTEQRDRDRDFVQPAGGITVEYEDNPVVFWGHESWAFPIGNSVKLKKELRGVDRKHIWSDARFAGNKQQHGFAETAYLLTRDGFIHAASIGFMPLQYVENKPDTEGPDGALQYNGYNIQKWLLLEWSLVGIPSNPGALVHQNGYEPSKDWPVQRVMDVARKFLAGSDLDSFRKGIIGAPEVIECSSCGVYEKSASPTEAVPARAFAANAEDDLGFDHWERVLGRACPDEGSPTAAKSVGSSAPAPAAKAADPEPEDTDPPVAPVVKTGESAPAKVARLAQEMNERTARALATRGRKAFAIGDRVRVRPGMEHEAEHAGISGTVAEVSGTAIGIRFDGMNEVHRWYITSELEPADAAAPMDSMGSEPADMGDAMTECTDACHECTSACRTCTSSCATCTTACTECTAACMACVESCKECVEACVQMMQAMGGAPAVGLTDAAQPMTMASFAAEVRKALADHATQVERIQVEVWALEQRKALDAPKTKSCGCTKAAITAPAEATPDPAPVAKDANTPASAAEPPSPAADPGLMERVLRAGFTAGREKHLGIVRL